MGDASTWSKPRRAGPRAAASHPGSKRRTRPRAPTNADPRSPPPRQQCEERPQERVGEALLQEKRLTRQQFLRSRPPCRELSSTPAPLVIPPRPRPRASTPPAAARAGSPRRRRGLWKAAGAYSCRRARRGARRSTSRRRGDAGDEDDCRKEERTRRQQATPSHRARRGADCRNGSNHVRLRRPAREGEADGRPDGSRVARFTPSRARA